jgi:excisionase family DNA binding protein
MPNELPLLDDLLTLKEASRELNDKVSLSSLYLAVQNKSLPHYRVSGGKKTRGKILLRRSELIAWLEGQKVTPASSPEGGLRHIRQPS